MIVLAVFDFPVRVMPIRPVFWPMKSWMLTLTLAAASPDVLARRRVAE